MESNFTITDEPKWNSKGAWKLPAWAEPIMVASILVGAMILTRSRGFKLFDRRRADRGLLDEEEEYRSADDALSNSSMIIYRLDVDEDSIDSTSTINNHPKKRECCGITMYTPNTSRFTQNLHSRILQKFPFLIEMFYWIITYTFYRWTKILSQAVFSNTTIWDVAEDNGLAILEFEQFSWLSFLWPIQEVDVQRWFMNGHQPLLTFLNRTYALIHIPGTVGFIAWFYYVAPSHATFAVVRRTMTLTNLFAFIIFIFYPCMPPRLLPLEYGFLDSVHHDDAQSVWMDGNYVNKLAAMPSMHFGYSFCIGCTLIYHSGILRQLQPGEMRKSTLWSVFYLWLGLAYPTLILVTIVATANHYYLDACVAFLIATLAFFCNRILLVLLPLEDLLLWGLRLAKPVPSTGYRLRR